MKLTEMELEVMNALWESKKPMTIPAILEVTKDTRTWSTRSIYTFLEYLERKGAVRVSRPGYDKDVYITTYEPAISCTEYMVLLAASINKARPPGLRVSADAYIDAVKRMWKDE